MMFTAPAALLRTRRRGLAAKAFSYSNDPIMVLDDRGNLAAINVACRLLMDADIAGCKNRGWRHLAKQLERRTNTPLFSPSMEGQIRRLCDEADAREMDLEDLKPLFAENQYASSQFGKAKVRTYMLPCIDSDSGDVVGLLIQIRLLDLEQKERFHESLTSRWHHELMWEVYAVLYDRMLNQLPFYQEVRDEHCRAMSLPGIQTVLDVGAGTGNVTMPLLKEGKSVTAVDIGSAMIERLLSKMEEETAENLTVIEDSAEWLPQLDDESFDGVTILLALYDMQNPFAALAEAVRVLRRGGMLMLTDPRQSFDIEKLMAKAEEKFREKGIFEQLHADWNKILVIKETLDATIKRIQTYGPKGKAARPWSAEAAFHILNDAGFDKLTMNPSYEGTCLTISGFKT